MPLDAAPGIGDNAQMIRLPALPIDDALPELVAAMRSHGRAVLQAPPGAGKTTRVPLALLDAGMLAPNRRLVMLEPRRLAARAAAERMADSLGEPVGQTVGYRMRGATKTSRDTRIEVVTEGILTRMLQSDPDLPGIGFVVFDEFHERSLNADLGLALCLEVAGALRDDLALLVMSATLDAEPVAALMDAPVITSEGRSYAVETRWLDRPLPARARRGDALVDLVTQAHRDTAATGGGMLVFLPGEGEIRRAEAALSRTLPAQCDIRPLFGAMPFDAQRAAIAPAQSGRDARASGQSTSYSGSGGGTGGASAQQPAWARRSPDATPGSVVAARAAAFESDRVEQMARDAAIAVIDARREVALIEGVSQPAEVIDMAQQTRDMANQMPDPLPTAPVLRKN